MAWTPSDLFSGGEDGFWYDFSDLSTLWQDTGATSPVTASGQSIARVDDKSGNGYNATQSTAGSRPTYTESGSLAYASYDGGDRLTIGSSTSTLAWLHKDGGVGIAAMVRFGTGSDPNAGYGVLGNAAGTSNANGVYCYYEDRTIVSANNKFAAAVSRNVNQQWTYQLISSDDAITPNTDVGYVVNIPSGGPLDGRIDNSSIGTAAQANSPSASNATYDMDIGTLGNNVLPLVGRLYHVITRDAEFTSTELQNLQNYFDIILGNLVSADVGVANETDSAITVTPALQATTVAVSTATETDTASAITPVYAVSVGQAAETDSALAISAQLFSELTFPTIGAFYTGSILGPNWRVYFYEPGTTTDKNVRDGSGVEHSNPVVMDRFGSIPQISVDINETYRIVIKNEYDVEKYTVGAFEYPDVVYTPVQLGVAEETDAALTITPA